MFARISTSVSPFLFVRRTCSSQQAVASAVNAATVQQSTKPTSNKSIDRQRHTNQKDVKVPPMNVNNAVDYLKSKCWAKFDETIEIAVVLGVDPRKPNQSIKGISTLPHGTGKNIRIGVFAQGADADTAIREGADVVGGADLIAKVQSGEINFDRVIATPEMMPALSKIGRILGPRGLMPNPKMGSVTTEIAKAIQNARIGTVQFRVDREGIVHAGIGKKSFRSSKLLENVRAFMMSLSDAKPEGLKGKYILKAVISSSMGPGVVLDTPSIDPSNGKFMLEASKLGGAGGGGKK